jgi:glycogen phosphorylase
LQILNHCALQSFNMNSDTTLLLTETNKRLDGEQVPYFKFLKELALDMRWSWIHAGDEIWRHLNPRLWELTHNPVVILQSLSAKQITHEMEDPHFQEKIKALVDLKQLDFKRTTWFEQHFSNTCLRSIAYFSMEYMLSEALPIYSGGLGNVAGDQLKAASDLGIPIVGLGLLYQQGYFRQFINREGIQQSFFPYNDPGQLPIAALRKDSGELLRLEIALPGHPIWLRVWVVQVGKLKLYLLDTNDMANEPIDRTITSELYGVGQELRLKQEMVLGIGGWKLLTALGIKPDVCHLNEGHAAFAVLERAREFMINTGQPFEVALTVTRAGNLFTTHTAVQAGFDRFDPYLIDQYLGWYCRDQLGISTKHLLSLGRKNAEDSSEPFNMAYLAIRGSAAVNGVSRMHAKVSKQLFGSLFDRWPISEVPVGYVTNGIHLPSWESEAADALWTEACGEDRWLKNTENLEHDIRQVDDERIWHMRNQGRESLIKYARERMSHQLAASGASPEAVNRARHIFDCNALTLVFARRFATYKRPNLLLQDQDRLLKLLTNPQYPVQLIIAGKAHPNDQPGQDMIRDWMHFIKMPEVHKHVIFLYDYDMILTEYMVQGADVWLNTPLKPWEACGTSGMKILVNGGINLSVMDGWWAEAYSSDVGWALTDKETNSSDAQDANALYTLLEEEIIPTFYNKRLNGIPVAWTAKIRESMTKLTPRFSVNRTVKEYTEQHYHSAAESYWRRAADNGYIGQELVRWNQVLKSNWDNIKFGQMNVKTDTQKHHYAFEAEILLNEIEAEDVIVELFADGADNCPPEKHVMKWVEKLYTVESQKYIFETTIETNRPSADYTVRIIPSNPLAFIPLEDSHILWHH